MLIQSMKMAVKSIAANKMRSFLTMLGIIIGVVALVVLVSLVDGATGSITDSINSLGSDMLNVTITDSKSQPVTLSDLDALTENDTIKEAAPVAQTSVTASGSYAEKTVSLTGTTGTYQSIQGLEVDMGRFLMSPDTENHANVAVINSDLANDVLGRENVIGEELQLGGRRFLVIGVYEDDSAMAGMTGGNYQAYIPYSVYIRMIDGAGSALTSFCVSAEEGDTDAAEETLNDYLLNHFHQDEDAFTILNVSSVAEAMNQVTGTLSLLLGGIAGISLLVGGIGIMNIMLVSVTERTKEIGIRKAIGAGRGTILLQFLIEALVISLIGCLIGILCSWIILIIINMIGSVSYGLSPGVVILSVAFSLGIGILFGIYPANKAAKMKPIDALRST